LDRFLGLLGLFGFSRLSRFSGLFGLLGFSGWNIGFVFHWFLYPLFQYSNIPIFHVVFSSIPSFQYSIIPMFQLGQSL